MGDLKQNLINSWQVVQAARLGIAEGVNHFVGGAVDGVAYGIGWAAQKVAPDIVSRRGILSGTFFKETLDTNSQQQARYDVEKETPQMKSVRTGVSTAVEGGLIIGAIIVPGLNLSTQAARLGGTATGASLDLLDVGGQFMQGFEKGSKKTEMTLDH